MKTLSFILIIPLMILAQTEFYISTAGSPIINECKMLKDSLPIQCSITTTIDLTGVVWNPDSVDWCATKEGYYRSINISYPPVWKIDNAISSFAPTSNNGFSIKIPVLDTLEHIITATYLQFSSVSLRYKGRNDKLPFLIYSGNRSVFSSDSVQMSIEATFPASFMDSPKMPKIQEDSSRNNTAILTFKSPSDTSIKMTTFLCNHQNIYSVSDFKATYSPTLNSYSILIPLTNSYSLAKKQNSKALIHDTINDTIFAVFQKQSNYDTIRVLFAVSIFMGYQSKIGNDMQYSDKFRYYHSFDDASLKNVVKVYDFKGRLVNKYCAISDNTKDITLGKLSKGVYFVQINGKKPYILH